MDRKRRLINICFCCFIGLAATVISAQTRTSANQPSSLIKRSDLFRPLPRTKFYDVLDPLPHGNPGDLIRSTQFDEYDLPPEVNALRFIYHSRTAAGADVAVSGVILFPEAKPPAEGWPVIAWAHSWTGVARSCAPSLARNLQHGPVLAMYVHLGYAVVATDYAGLGTASRSAFGDLSANAWDVLYSVAAARHVLPQLGARWIAMGTGEGGMAVVRLAEIESNLHDVNFLGSMAVSRLADLRDLYTSQADFTSNLPLFLAYGIQTEYPQFDVNDLLTAEGLPLFRQIGQQCSVNADGSAQKTPALAMLKPGWQANAFVQKYFDQNRLGLVPSSAPLLVIASQADPLLEQTIKVVARMCRQGDHVEFEKYQESDPGRVIGDSARDQMSWIQLRFGKGVPQSNCPAPH